MRSCQYRRIFLKLPSASGRSLGNFRQQGAIISMHRLLHGLGEHCLDLWSHLRQGIRLPGIIVQVPDIQHTHALQTVDIGSIAFDTTLDCGITPATIQAVGASRHIYAGHEALQVPFPRTDDSLIKIVKIKNNLTQRSAVHAEVVQMSVAVDDHGNAADRRRREIGRHDACRAAKESKWRGRHTPHTQGNEMLLSALVTFCYQLQGIRPIVLWLPFGVRFAWRSAPQLLSLGTTLFPGLEFSVQLEFWQW